MNVTIPNIMLILPIDLTQRSVAMSTSDEQYADAHQEQEEEEKRHAEAPRQTAPAAPTMLPLRTLQMNESPHAGRSIELIDVLLKRLEQSPTHMTLEIEDKQLGTVEVKAFLKNGIVELSISVQSDDARIGIERELGDLHMQCDARGIKLGATAFSVKRRRKGDPK